MNTEEIEKELIKIFTRSKAKVSRGTSRRGNGADEAGYFLLVKWKKYYMWILPNYERNNKRTIEIRNQIDTKVIFQLQEIPTKALAILAITCRPAYEFYKQHWMEK